MSKSEELGKSLDAAADARFSDPALTFRMMLDSIRFLVDDYEPDGVKDALLVGHLRGILSDLG